jgi:hypothetical protein
MKRLLQLGFVLGLAGALAAAYFAPWIGYTRYRAATSVVANGGRVELFMVRLPADRIGDPITTTADNASAPRLEHFKLRDADGNVIGIAARHELSLADTAETAWLLTIPSRGTIALAASSPQAGSIDSVLAASGLVAGQSAERELSIDLVAPAHSVTATGEFAGISFDLIETWVVTGLDAKGQVRGTLRLNTVGRQST